MVLGSLLLALGWVHLEMLGWVGWGFHSKLADALKVGWKDVL